MRHPPRGTRADRLLRALPQPRQHLRVRHLTDFGRKIVAVSIVAAVVLALVLFGGPLFTLGD